MSGRPGDVPAQSGPLHTYFDARHGLDAIRLLPNEYVVSSDDLVLSTVLGSCVSACLRDPVAGVGGLNHFMLPVAGPEVAAIEAKSMRYGQNAMDTLIDALEARGARRERLEAKVFGGATLMADMRSTRVGEANADFVLDYLQARGIPVLSQDLKDRCARQLYYFPATGRARVRRLSGNDTRLAQHDSLLADTLVKALPLEDMAGLCAVDIERRRREQAS